MSNIEDNHKSRKFDAYCDYLTRKIIGSMDTMTAHQQGTISTFAIRMTVQYLNLANNNDLSGAQAVIDLMDKIHSEIEDAKAKKALNLTAVEEQHFAALEKSVYQEIMTHYNQFVVLPKSAGFDPSLN